LKSSRIKNVSLERNLNGCILKIESRKSPKFCRVSEKKVSLKNKNEKIKFWDWEFSCWLD